MLLGEEFHLRYDPPCTLAGTSASIPSLVREPERGPQLDRLGPRGAVGRLSQDRSTTTSLIWITGVKSV